MLGTIRLGIIGNSSQVRQHYLNLLRSKHMLPCEVEIAWVAGCSCESGFEYDKCPFRDPNVPNGLLLGFDPIARPPCAARIGNAGRFGNVDEWRRHVDDGSVDAVLVSTPNALHSAPIAAFLSQGVPVAVDKPPVVHADEARSLVELAERKQVPFVTLAQRRFEDVYLLMAEKIRGGEMGDVQLVSLVFVHGWTPTPQSWRSKASLAGGGVLIDSVYNCLDVLLWLLRQSDSNPQPVAVHAQWNLQDPKNHDAVEVRATVGVRFDTGCLLNITAASTALAPNSVDENIKIFGQKGILRYQRDKVSRGSMAAGQLTFQSSRFPEVEQILVPAGQSQGFREAPLADFLRCVHDRNRQPQSPTRDGIDVLDIIERAYQSAKNGGTLIPMKLKITEVDHVAVQTSDLDAALAFYVGILGAELIVRQKFKKREMAWLRVGGTKIELFSKREGEALNRWSDFYSGPVHISFRVEQLEAFLREALAKGAKFHPSHPEPFVPPAAGASKIAYLLGPDGEEVEIRDRDDITPNA